LIVIGDSENHLKIKTILVQKSYKVCSVDRQIHAGRFLTIEIPYRERIKILSDLLLDGKRGLRNKNQEFKREISRIKKER
jgi:hypothetical protein